MREYEKTPKESCALEPHSLGCGSIADLKSMPLPRISCYVVPFLLRDADMHSAYMYLLRRRGWVAGWLGGWVDVCPSHAGIVSKQLNLS